MELGLKSSESGTDFDKVKEPVASESDIEAKPREAEPPLSHLVSDRHTGNGKSVMRTSPADVATQKSGNPTEEVSLSRTLLSSLSFLILCCYSSSLRIRLSPDPDLAAAWRASRTHDEFEPSQNASRPSVIMTGTESKGEILGLAIVRVVSDFTLGSKTSDSVSLRLSLRLGDASLVSGNIFLLLKVSHSKYSHSLKKESRAPLRRHLSDKLPTRI